MAANDQNLSQTTKPPSNLTNPELLTWHKSVIGVSIVISIAGLFGYAFYIFLILKNRKTSFSNPFYTLTLSLSLPECLDNLTMLCFAFPVNFTGQPNSGIWPWWLQWILGFLNDVCWFALIAHVTTIATNRFIAIVCYTRYNSLFNKRRILAMVVGCYMISFVVPGMQYVCGCQQIFMQNTWFIICDSGSGSNGNGSDIMTKCANVAMMLDMVLSNAIVVYVVLINVLVVFFARRAAKRTKKQLTNGNSGNNNENARIRSSNERSLIIQCSAVSTVLFVYNTSFWLIQSMIENGWCSQTSGAVLVNLIYVINNSMNPYIYFAFSSEIRKKALAIKCISKIWS